MYIFNQVFAWLHRYRAWLGNGKYRAEVILCSPVAASFLIVLMAPAEFFEWYYSSTTIAMSAPVVVVPLLPFYVVTYLQAFKKTN
jgi:hypothetical protein